MATDLPVAALKTVLANASGLPTSRIWWNVEEQAAFGPFEDAAGIKAGALTCTPISREIVGVEEIRSTYDAVTGTFSELYVGARRVTISIRADNFLGLGEAYDLLERLRVRLFLRSARRDLRAADLVFIDADSIVNLDYQVDNRHVSSANLDLRFRQVVGISSVTDPLDVGQIITKVTYKAPPLNAAVEPEVNLVFTRKT